MTEFEYTKIQKFKDDIEISILNFLIIIIEKWLKIGKKIFGKNYGNWANCKEKNGINNRRYAI